jgi:hypothetical protein
MVRRVVTTGARVVVVADDQPDKSPHGHANLLNEYSQVVKRLIAGLATTVLLWGSAQQNAAAFR